MRGATHLIVSVTAATAVAAHLNVDAAASLSLIGLAAVGGILPDIDHPHAPIRRTLGLPGHLLFGWLPHRGFTHSLLCGLLVTLAAAHLLPPLGWGLGLGWLLHSAADLITPGGIRLLWPLRSVQRLPPGIPVGSLREALLAALTAAAGLLLWLSHFGGMS